MSRDIDLEMEALKLLYPEQWEKTRALMYEWHNGWDYHRRHSNMEDREYDLHYKATSEIIEKAYDEASKIGHSSTILDYMTNQWTSEKSNE